jgi:hypothetical protein
MWNSPDIRDHVNEESDFRIGKLINRLTFESETREIGDYEYTYTGEYTYLDIPDISAEKIMEKVNQMTDLADEYDFKSDSDYRSPEVAYGKYNNVTFYPFILLINKIPTNARFKSDIYPKLKLLSEEQIRDILIPKSSNKSHTAKRVESTEEFERIYNDNIKKSTDPESAIDDWLKIKIPNFDFSNIQNTKAYEKLKNEIGETKLLEYIKKMDKYHKKGGTS